MIFLVRMEVNQRTQLDTAIVSVILASKVLIAKKLLINVMIISLLKMTMENFNLVQIQRMIACYPPLKKANLNCRM
jgi:hypothetical protein